MYNTNFMAYNHLIMRLKQQQKIRFSSPNLDAFA